jgi:hypothetical protein
MKVICRAVDLTDAQKAAMEMVGSKESFFLLTVGATYTVLGILCGAGVLGGVVLHVPGEDYIIPAPLCLFDIVDPRPSRYWVPKKMTEFKMALWPEEFYQPYFHDILSDFDPACFEIYRRVRAQMESEFE